MKYVTGGYVGEDEAGERLAQCIADPKCSKSGVYWSWNGGAKTVGFWSADGKPRGAGGSGGEIFENEYSDAVSDEKTAKKMWELSKKMVGLSAQTRAHTGAVSVVQRGDSALRLNVHFNRVSGESEATYSHAHRTFSPEGSNMWCQLAWENDSYQVTSSKGASLRSYEGTSHSCLLFPPLRYGNATCSCSTASTSATRRASSSSTRSRRRRPTR